MKFLSLSSHPTQYHAPLFQLIGRYLNSLNHEFVVIYLSDFSVKTYLDKEFNISLTWDESLLSGYDSIVFDTSGRQPSGFYDLTANSIFKYLVKQKPNRILFTTLNYFGAIQCLVSAKLLNIPCTIRVETNDQANPRTLTKSLTRNCFYRFIYQGFDSAIAIGTLNRNHFINHGIPRQRIDMAYYSVVDRFQCLSEFQKSLFRTKTRSELSIPKGMKLILFCGKLIPKKNPMLILDALAILSHEQRSSLGVVFVGSGVLYETLSERAETISGCHIHFAGFKNQSELAGYYLAADIFILPSRRQGETWGLVVNEALHSGLPCLISDAVGCQPDFSDFPDVYTFPDNDACTLANHIVKCMGISRNFSKYSNHMISFSQEVVAQKIADTLLMRG